MQVTNDQGKAFFVKVVSKGDAYGLRKCLTHDKDDPLVEFYGLESPWLTPEGESKEPEDPDGFFISNYYLSTLLEAPNFPEGLNLHRGQPGCILTAENMATVVAWLTEGLSSRT